MPDSEDAIAELLDAASAEDFAADPVKQMLLGTAMLASDLFIPVHESADEQAQAGGVSLVATPVNDVPHVLLFSSQQKLADMMGAGQRFARASGKDVLMQLQSAHAILNPGPHGRAMAPEDIRKILGKSASIPHGQPGHVHGPGCKH